MRFHYLFVPVLFTSLVFTSCEKETTAPEEDPTADLLLIGTNVTVSETPLGAATGLDFWLMVSTEMPGYFVIALRGQYVLKHGITLNAGIDNLTNEYYYDHLDWSDIPRPGRNFYLSFEIER